MLQNLKEADDFMLLAGSCRIGLYRLLVYLQSSLPCGVNRCLCVLKARIFFTVDQFSKCPSSATYLQHGIGGAYEPFGKSKLGFLTWIIPRLLKQLFIESGRPRLHWKEILAVTIHATIQAQEGSITQIGRYIDTDSGI